MDRNTAREQIGEQIRKLGKERDTTQDPAKKAAAIEAIAALQQARRQINTEANDKIGEAVDKLVTELEEVQTRHPHDAVSALGRTIDELNQARGAGRP